MREVLKDTGMVLDYPAFIVGDQVGVVGYNDTFRVRDYWFDVLEGCWVYRVASPALAQMYGMSMDFPESDVRAIAAPTIKKRGGYAAKE